MARSPFIWSGSGEKLTPKEVERRRAMSALAAARGSDTSPVGHWTQGAARLIDAFGGYRGNVLAGRAENEGQAGAKAIIDALMGGGGAPMQGAGAPMSAMQPPAGDMAMRLREGMIQRGLPEHVADGFLMNFQDESGLNPGINEANPTVPGSRGGFGLYQLTGPRRTAYEQFAAQRGVPLDDPDAQLDFMIHELQGPEAAAAQSILSAPDAGSAAAAIARDFLRPAPDHLQRRVAEYTGGQSGAGVASGPGGVSPVMQALLQASTDPWVAQEYGPVINALMGQEAQRQEYAMRQADPLRQIQLQQAQLDLERSQQPQPATPIEVGGVLLDPVTFQPIFDSRSPDDPIAALRSRAAEAGLQPGTPEYAAFMASGGKPETGMVIESDGQGGFRMVQGTAAGAAAGRPFTEGQSKDIVYATRARGALEVLEPIANSLTSRKDRLAERDPTGFARGLQSDDFQVANNAGSEFLTAILRKDTGAAITDQEQEIYGKIYLPQPGDGPELLEARRQARLRAVAALEAGMSPAQMLAQERALLSGEVSNPEVPAAPAAQDAPAPKRLRYNPATGALE